MKVHDFSTDFTDGVKLYNLVEIWSGKTIPDCNPEPSHPAYKIKNINYACKFMRDKGKNLPVIPVEGA